MTAHFIATGLPSQQNRSDKAFRFKRAAFYMGLKSKVGLVAAKASALRINLNIQGVVCCLLVLNSVTSTPQWIRQPEAAWYATALNIEVDP